MIKNFSIYSFLLCLFHATHPSLERSCYDKNWMICHPTTTVSEKSEIPTKAYEALKDIGTQANQVSLSTLECHAKAKKLDTVFAPINRSFLVKAIDDILSSDTLLEEVTKASYKNVIGFLKIVLFADKKDSWKLRLHIWDQKEKEYPHNHKWDFFSKIMTGYLTQNLYRKAENHTPNSVPYCICEPVSLMPLLPNGEKPCPCKDSYVLSEKELQHVFLQHHNQSIIGTGESYFMSNDLIHTINPGNQAITFVFTSQNHTENSEVFVPKNLIGTKNLQKHAPSVTKKELVEELYIIKKMLSRLPISQRYLPELIHPEHKYFNRKHTLLNFENWRNEVLNSQATSHVKQLSDIEKENYIVHVNELGNICIGKNNVVENQEYLFVLLDNVMYAYPKDFSHNAQELICHSSFVDYASVDAAGLLKFNKDGSLAAIEAYSGHYEPSLSHMVLAKEFLASIGTNLQHTSIQNYTDR